MTVAVEEPPPPPRPPGTRRPRAVLDDVGSLVRRAGDVAGSDTRPAQAGRYVALAVAFLVVVELLFHQSPADLVNGLALGSLYGLMGVAMVLIYRTMRVINFAAAAIGSVPAVVALYLGILFHVNYLVALPVALIGGPLMGALTNMTIMRRFTDSPRLIVTVLTIGVAESFALLTYFIPIWMGHNAKEVSVVPTPWQNFAIHNGRGQPVLTGNELAEIVVVLALTVGLILFLRGTRIGLALRASAENADRAALLGIPVRRLSTVAWMLAGLLAALAIYFQSPVIGVPQDTSLVLDPTLLYALTAAVVARFNKIGLALGAGCGVGILAFASVQSTGSSDVASAEMFVVIMLALLLQRGGIARAYDTGVETWRSLKEFRPVPTELRAVRQVTAMRLAVPAALVVVAVLLGLRHVGIFFGPPLISGPNVPDLVILPIFGIVAVSMVVLTGWSGQISLGQFGLAAAGALVTGGLVADHNPDFFAVLGLGIVSGVAVAVLIGLPAARFPGMYLAVTTLAFNYAMVYYVMNPHYWIGAHLMPTGLAAQINRPDLWQRIALGDIGPNRNYYFLCLALLGLAMAAATSFRRYHSGRVLIAVRDNQKAASSFAINIVRSRVAAFAVAGGIAGMAGVLLMYAQGNVIPDSFAPQYSIIIFLAVVVGGANSLPWAVVGAVTFEAFILFGPKVLDPVLGPTVTAALPLILAGPGLIVTLLQYPAGNAEWGYSLRDRYLRRVAARRHILVPSLVADRRVEADQGREAISRAGRHYDEVRAHPQDETGNGAARPAAGEGPPSIVCPVCGAELDIDEAPDHEHLRAPAAAPGPAGEP